jgi:hypothetical protein
MCKRIQLRGHVTAPLLFLSVLRQLQIISANDNVVSLAAALSVVTREAMTMKHNTLLPLLFTCVINLGYEAIMSIQNAQN